MRHILWSSVRPSVRQSQAGIVPKMANAGSRKQRHTTAHGLRCSGAKDLGAILTGGAKYRWTTLKSAIFHQYLAISQKRWK